MYNKNKLSQIILSGLMAVSFSSISLPIEAADVGLHVDQVGYLSAKLFKSSNGN